MEICCECCVLSGRTLCDELITHPEESYRLCCVVMCDLETLVNEEALAHWRGFWAKKILTGRTALETGPNGKNSLGRPKFL